INPVATLHSLRYGRTNGVKTILNPAPAPVPSENNELGNYELLDMILSNSDFKKVRWPIVTLGSKGAIAVLYAEDMVGMQNNDVSVVAHVSLGNEEKLIVHLASPKIDDVTDTTGAGDCFVGSLAYFVACHENITTAEQIRRSIWLASQSIRKKGTQSSYPKREELPSTLFTPETYQWP
ncbi:unnamed protein product, partial [Trichobilharzia regenti]